MVVIMWKRTCRSEQVSRAAHVLLFSATLCTALGSSAARLLQKTDDTFPGYRPRQAAPKHLQTNQRLSNLPIEFQPMLTETRQRYLSTTSFPLFFPARQVTDREKEEIHLKPNALRRSHGFDGSLPPPGRGIAHIQTILGRLPGKEKPLKQLTRNLNFEDAISNLRDADESKFTDTFRSKMLRLLRGMRHVKPDKRQGGTGPPMYPPGW
ncbi:uncharacterized protein LOC106161420 [Lingula anatina]|uniref:Uncharacterized protein LOC106161420 n=1 Tax=Lingula anatina TaxID=7574 RepID=A0A1S3I6J1_LINAN|nr:uncharacterized protein LOC106161420 [Lingula anatina]|eukprot:XP_013393823.1 uncharacterized protein LOC106161420 [Lingula anatina]